MNDLIPRLEWNEQSVTATRVSGNPTLSSISSTANIIVGMIASGTGIPTGATVISKTVSSVTLNTNASLSGTSVITFVQRYDFQYPPKTDSEEKLIPNQIITSSLSGLNQYQTMYLEANRDLEFDLVRQADADTLQNDFYYYALLGNSFKYYQDKDVVSYQTMELDMKSFIRKRRTVSGGLFFYQINFSMRRVVY